MKRRTAYLGKEKVTILDSSEKYKICLIRFKNKKERVVCQDELKDIN